MVEASNAAEPNAETFFSKWERVIKGQRRRKYSDDSPSAPEATDPIAAMREALGILCDEIEATEEHDAAAFENFCPVCKAIERARAALAAYDAAVASSRQSVGVEEIAREIAKRASSGDTSNTPQDVADCIVAEIDNNTESEGSTWRKRRN